MKSAIVTCADEAFLPAACFMLSQASKHLPVAGPVDLWLVVHDVPDDAVSAAQDFFACRGAEVRITPIVQSELGTFPTNHYIKTAMYARLFLDRVLAANDYDRVLYLDSDVMVLTDLTPLIEHELDGRPAGAVHDYQLYAWESMTAKQLQLPLEQSCTYFNSGVMLFDWKQALEQDLLAQARMIVAMRGNALIHRDQDALNIVLEGKWAPLDPRWNQGTFYMRTRGRHRPNIVHFTGIKPWQENHPTCLDKFGKLMETALAGSPWPDFVSSPDFRVRAVRRIDETYALIKDSVLANWPNFGEEWHSQHLARRAVRIRRRSRRRNIEHAVETMISEARAGGAPPVSPGQIFPDFGARDLAAVPLAHPPRLRSTIEPAVYANLTGGLGNQLFQYACAYALARTREAPLKVYWEAADTHIARDLELDFLVDDLVQMSPDEEDYWIAPLRQGLERRRIYRERDEFIYDPQVMQLQTPCFLRGNWQNQKFFIEWESDLRAQFSAHHKLSPQSAGLVAEVRDRPTVSVHVRQTDYNWGPHKRILGEVCTRRYYQAAMAEMRRKVPDCQFILFSDDMNVAAELIDSKYPLRLDIGGTQSGPEDLLIMSSCHHHIIANSTFSWWAAWLNNARDKQVIAPQYWMTPLGRERYNLAEVCPPEWLRVKV
jgi:lipopolysaccharide biosynthesis glycosyltransferase